MAVSTSRMSNISRLFLGTSWIRDLFTSAEAASVIKSRIPSLAKNNPYFLKCTEEGRNLASYADILLARDEPKECLRRRLGET